ncbi:hypothetical protein PCASD_21084 [Puccinia coronata f. sp. avenae]|uniref:Uncharacterized protein n=1 Tax=Puccinia coronata f. sp. avenae TaxID=200324 RepID=A0A2N5TSB1_9BASI|nr:hypothetical protein PCASD_21084 [Puccinia coronata f. sp. avenae]
MPDIIGRTNVSKANVTNNKWPSQVRCKTVIPEWENTLSRAGLLEEYGDVITRLSSGFNQGIPVHNLDRGVHHYTPESQATAWQAKEKIKSNLEEELAAGRM